MRGSRKRLESLNTDANLPRHTGRVLHPRFDISSVLVYAFANVECGEDAGYVVKDGLFCELGACSEPPAE